VIQQRRLTPAAMVAVLFALFWVLVTALPFFFMFMTSFKTQPELFQSGSVFALPDALYFGNYIEILTGRFFMYLRNSIIVCSLAVVVLLIISSMASYVFSRLKFRMNAVLFSVVIACMAIPIHATLIPVFILTRDIGLYDQPLALVGPYIAFNIPVSVFVLTGFMKTIPVELEESAEIDGASKVRTFLSIIMPLAIPGLATLAIYNGINMWNEFIYALVLTSSVQSRTLPLAIWEYQGQYGVNIPMVMTILALSVMPMIIAFLILQERLIKGMMVGAVKG